MRNFETIDDVIYFAIESEIQSIEFYNRLAEAAPEGETKLLFSKLMEEEKSHIVRLQYLLDHQSELGFPSLSHHFSEEKYLPHVIPSPQLSVTEGLKVAIQKEKAAYSLYKDLAAETKKHDFNKFFLLLASEEESHCQRFENEYDALTTQK
ncbi:MAG: ferritin family protein [Bacteroidota bacterium]|nr:ferritin family protein [Bacteroidota bacterium]